MKHWLAHLFGLDEGEVVTWWDIDVLMCGFQCDECGEISGAHMIGVYHYERVDGKWIPEFRWKLRPEEFLPRREKAATEGGRK